MFDILAQSPRSLVSTIVITIKPDCYDTDSDVHNDDDQDDLPPPGDALLYQVSCLATTPL